MMRLIDTSRLAATKLRTRRIRLIITIVIAGLLFSALAAASQVSRGAFASIDNFSEEGFGKRYLVQASPHAIDTGLLYNPAILDRAVALEKDTQNKKTAEAKRLGISYDPKSEQPAVEEFDTPQGKIRTLSVMHPSGYQALSEYIQANQQAGMAELQKAGNPYGATHYYQSRMLINGPSSPSIAILKDGKESFEHSQGFNQTPTGVDTLPFSWSMTSGEMLHPFLLPGATTAIGKDGVLPIVAPYDAIEQLLKLRPLSANASPESRLERIRTVRAKASNITIQVCYRNQASLSQVNKAISTQQEIERNKGNKEYQKPALIYGLPQEACGPATILSDKRSKEQKLADDKQLQFDRTFGEQAPDQRILNFRVIGISPAAPAKAASSIDNLMNGLLVSSIGSDSWFTPYEVLESQPILNGLFDKIQSQFTGLDHYFAEFSDAGQAQQFISKQNCRVQYADSSGISSERTDTCQQQKKYFELSAFGSNSLALNDAKQKFGKLFSLAALGVAAIAAIILIGTVGRTIADSRRETAVFRAIGATRLDIAQVYLLYTLMLSIIICSFALAVGSLAAWFVDQHYGPHFTVQALVAYNAQNLERVFSLRDAYLPDMVKIAGLALVSSLASSTIPLLRNLRRNPIRDMRDDT